MHITYDQFILELRECYNSVVDWNILAGNPCRPNFTGRASTSLDPNYAVALPNQTRRIKSELLETNKATDYAELLDGVCDVFVTAAYLCYLRHTELETLRLTLEGFDSAKPLPGPYIKERAGSLWMAPVDTEGKFGIITANMILSASCYWLWRLQRELDIDSAAALRAILEDNHSKFIPSVTIWAIQETCAHYVDAGQEVLGTVMIHNGVRYGVFRRRSDNKIMKPVSYLKAQALDLRPFFWKAQVNSDTIVE